MTFPITPLPGIHNDSINIQALEQQAIAELAAVTKIFETFANQIIMLVVNAILRAFGLSAFIGPIDQVITQLESLFENFPGSVISGVTAIEQEIVDGIANALGIPGLGHDVSVILAALTNIPGSVISGFTNIEQRIIDAIANALGHPGTGHTINDIEVYLTQIPAGLIQGALSAVTMEGQSITGEITNALFNSFNLFAQIPLIQLPFIPASHVVNSNPELLWNSGFDTSASVSANGGFTWDGTVGHTAVGSAKATAKGVLCNLISSPIAVTTDETLNLSVWAQWSGLTTSGSNPAPIRMEALQYHQGVKVRSTVIASKASPGSFSAWTQLTGSFIVPGDVDTVYLSLIVDTTATGGSVWFDDASVYKAGSMAGGYTLQTAWENLLTSLFGANSIEEQLLSQILPDITRFLSSDLQALIDAVCNALGIPGVGHQINTALAALENIPAAVIRGATQWDQALWSGLSQALNGITAFENNIQNVIWNDIGYAENQVMNWVQGYVPSVIRSIF